MHSGPYILSSRGDKRYFGYHHSYPAEPHCPISEPACLDGKIAGWSGGDRLIMSQEQQQPPIEPHEHDVLMGRGGRNNQHSGNDTLRQFARVQKDKYRVASKKGKSALSRYIVQQMRELDPPARYVWYLLEVVWFSLAHFSC